MTPPAREPCTHPCHIGAVPQIVADFTWTCPRCKAVVPIMAITVVDPTPALVTK